MASLRVHPDRLEISLSTAEKSLSLRREDIIVQRDNIRSIAITDDPWIWIRGIRAPGTIIPLVLAVGTWKFHGGKDFVAIKSKRQAVVIDLIDEEYSRVILTTKHAPELIASLKLIDSQAGANTESDSDAEVDAGETVDAETADAETDDSK
ncbi:hypothetical protein [Leifsonia sp. A12D58]|uniref:hypothetical protein n=1 Tax=Leifsonia sp. A12D58 TaxID=3397674 RepID=UPI0039E13CCE